MRAPRHCESSQAIQPARRWPLDCRVAVLLAMTVAGCSTQPPIPPGGIVSNNPCIDAILAEVAAPGQIAAVSAYSHDPDSGSAPIIWARKLPALGTSAEEIIAAKPKLLLTGNFSAGGTNAALAKAGVTLIGFGVPATVEESVAQVRAVAKAIGRAEAGERLAARIEEAITQNCFQRTARPELVEGSYFPNSGRQETKTTLRQAQGERCDWPVGDKYLSAIIWQGGGFVAGKGTLQDELLTRTGYTNASDQYGLRQWDILPAETLLRNPPDVIFMPATASGEEGRGLSARVKLLRHVKGKARVVTFPDKLLFCGGPTIVEAMAVLRSGKLGGQKVGSNSTAHPELVEGPSLLFPPLQKAEGKTPLRQAQGERWGRGHGT
jgi:iron complex transport system substrate-binding protein